MTLGDHLIFRPDKPEDRGRVVFLFRDAHWSKGTISNHVGITPAAVKRILEQELGKSKTAEIEKLNENIRNGVWS